MVAGMQQNFQDLMEEEELTLEGELMEEEAGGEAAALEAEALAVLGQSGSPEVGGGGEGQPSGGKGNKHAGRRVLLIMLGGLWGSSMVLAIMEGAIGGLGAAHLVAMWGVAWGSTGTGPRETWQDKQGSRSTGTQRPALTEGVEYAWARRKRKRKRSTGKGEGTGQGNRSTGYSIHTAVRGGLWWVVMCWNMTGVEATGPSAAGQYQGVASTAAAMAAAAAATVALQCMTLNMNGGSMRQQETGAQKGRWVASRKMAQLWDMAKQKGWKLMVLTETHHTMPALRATQKWWADRGYGCCGSPGLMAQKLTRAGVCVVWHREEVKVHRHKVTHVGRGMRVDMEWVRSGKHEVLLAQYMPVRGGTEAVVDGAWEGVGREARAATLIAGDLNAEGQEMRRGKEMTKADQHMEELLGSGWKRISGEECTYRDSVLDHWLAHRDRGDWGSQGVSEGISGAGDHKVVEVQVWMSNEGAGKDRQIKLNLGRLTEADWQEYREKVTEKMRRLQLTEGEEGIEVEGKAGLQIMQKVQIEVAVAILNRREQESGGSKGAKGHLEQHKRWSKLYGWVERKKGDHPCFSTPEASCRLLRDPGIRRILDRHRKARKAGLGWDAEGVVRAVLGRCRRKREHHWKQYARAKEHSWDAGMQRLKAAARRGGSVVHEAFKVVRGRVQGGTMSRFMEVWDGQELVGGPAVREVVQRLGGEINQKKEAYLEAVDWWATKVWGPSKERKSWEGA